LQLLKKETLIPAPADCAVWSVIKFLKALQELRRAIQNKRRGMLSAGIVFLHDNARPHTAQRTASLLQEFSWEVFNHPPYNPDLAPSDFHLFLLN
jgi:transposase